jgi:hypothetical protein
LTPFRRAALGARNMLEALTGDETAEAALDRHSGRAQRDPESVSAVSGEELPLFPLSPYHYRFRVLPA